MNEASYVTRLAHTFKALAPSAVVTKYNDRVTSAIPDLSVTFRGRTLWVEGKTQRTQATPQALRPADLRGTNRHLSLQLHALWHYGVASGGRAFLAVFTGARLSLYRVDDPQGTLLTWVATGTLSEMAQYLLHGYTG